MIDKFNEECAVVGVIGCPDAANYCYLALYSMQHRGQEGAGIVSCDDHTLMIHRDMGLVADVFSSRDLVELKGSAAIGHTRYATCGSKDRQNLQPLVANFQDRSFAIAHNGNLVNATEVRAKLEATGSIFSTTSDTEVFLHLMARCSVGESLQEKLITSAAYVRGAYSLVVLSAGKLIAVRDPAGVRPLSLAKLPPVANGSSNGTQNQGYIVASETCAFDLVGAEFVRDIAPGEVLEIDEQGNLKSSYLRANISPALCVFEYIYFARPDSVIDGRSVYNVRKRLGHELAIEHPASGADLVIPVPDSGVPAAMGYAEQSGIVFDLGLIRNHYIGRTFIEPRQSIRDFGVKIKLNCNREVLAGKSVVVVDDSIVRGTTCRKIVKMLRDGGTREVHFRISSPPTVGPCHYGIDTPSREELIAANHSVEEICKYIGADSLGYLSIPGMYRAVRGDGGNFCDACFSRNYRLGELSNDKNKGTDARGCNASGCSSPEKKEATERLCQAHSAAQLVDLGLCSDS